MARVQVSLFKSDVNKMPGILTQTEQCVCINIYVHTHIYMGFPDGASGKESAFQCGRHKRHGFDPWVGKISWRRAWKSTPVFVPGEFYGERSLVGYSPWGHKELDMTETTEHAHENTYIYTHTYVYPIGYIFIYKLSIYINKL